MNTPVVFLKSAKEDLKELKNYIVKNFGKDAWLASYNKIKESISTIQAFPLRGSIPEELENLNLTAYRQVISGMNRIIYQIRQDAIYIHIICDTRKSMESLLARRLLGTMNK